VALDQVLVLAPTFGSGSFLNACLARACVSNYAWSLAGRWARAGACALCVQVPVLLWFFDAWAKFQNLKVDVWLGVLLKAWFEPGLPVFVGLRSGTASEHVRMEVRWAGRTGPGAAPAKAMAYYLSDSLNVTTRFSTTC
jgi:hypothetical protein